MASGRELADFDGRIATLRQQLETHRQQAQSDPLGWIQANAIGEPEVAPAPPPAPAPAPLVRGRVKLPADELAADFH
jgi:hypothetical protein